MFAAAREAIAERSARDVLTPEAAAKAIARITAVKTGSKYDGYPVLGNIFRSEEAASTVLGGVQIATVMTFIDREPTKDIDTTLLPGDVWLRFVRTRSRDDALRMAEHRSLGFMAVSARKARMATSSAVLRMTSTS